MDLEASVRNLLAIIFGGGVSAMGFIVAIKIAGVNPFTEIIRLVGG